MTASISEVLTELGSWTLPLEWDPDLVEVLVDGTYMLLWWGEELVAAGVKTDDEPDKDLLTVGGVSPEWALGLDAIGPTERDKEYVSGRNKLSNGAFIDGEDLWKITEGSKWTVPELGPARTTADFDKDDVLASSETFESRPGNRYRLKITAGRDDGAIARLRGRLVLEGRFDPSDLLPGLGDSTDASEHAGDTSVVGSTIVMGPVTRKTGLSNGGFETGDFSGWTPSGAWSIVGGTTFEGAYCAACSDTDGGLNYLTPDVDPGTPGSQPIDVKPHERWEVKGAIAKASGTDGFVSIDTFLNNLDLTQQQWSQLMWFSPDQIDDTGWRSTTIEIDIPDGMEWLWVQPQVFSQTAGSWYFDAIQATRLIGNSARRRLGTVALTPERTYKLLAPAAADAACTQGTVKFAVLFQGAGRPDQIVESQPVDYQAKDRTLLDFSFKPPSGYDSATVWLVATDVLGGAISVLEKPTLTLDDKTRTIVDLLIGPGLASAGDYELEVMAPIGTEKVHVELVAESLGRGFFVFAVELTRTETPWSSADVVRDLIRNPASGTPILLEGRLFGAEAIQHDWHVLNLTRRAELQQFSRTGIALPFREWRVYVDPDLGPMLDWGTPAEIFTDHRGPEAVLLETDFDVITPPKVARSSKNVITDVVVIGADRQDTDGGPPSKVTGQAATSAEVLDWWGQPLERTQVVTEPTATHRSLAASLAAYRASLANAVNENLRVFLSDWRPRGLRFVAGDTLYLYKPEAGVEDPANPMVIDERTVFPKGYRVTERLLRPGPGFRLEFRPPGRAPIVLERDAVRWEDATVAELTLGNPRASFVNDPQGGSVAAQWRRFRASMPA